MARFRPAVPLILALAAPVALGGCAVALVGGVAAAGAGAGYTAAQERGFNGTIDDLSIKTNIETAWLDANPNLQTQLTIDVYEGRVLLTGSVPRTESKAEAVDLARHIAGVRALYDHIEVAPAETAWETMRDAWTTTRLRSDMMLDRNIRSINYQIDTERGSVYLIGSARTQGELNRVTNLARGLPNVRRVVSYVEIRPGATVTASEARLPPPAGEPSAPPPPMPPAPVEVHRL
jgi:osmotically-inducible protein OsmY